MIKAIDFNFKSKKTWPFETSTLWSGYPNFKLGPFHQDIWWKRHFKTLDFEKHISCYPNRFVETDYTNLNLRGSELTSCQLRIWASTCWNDNHKSLSKNLVQSNITFFLYCLLWVSFLHILKVPNPKYVLYYIVSLLQRYCS